MSQPKHFCSLPKAPSTLFSSLALKILVPVLCVMLLTCLSLFALYNQRMRQQGIESLKNQLATFTASKAEELAEPLWSFQDDMVERLIRSYRDNRDLHKIILYDDKGKAIASAEGDESLPQSAIMRAERDITRTVDGETFKLGRLVVEYHDANILAGIAARRHSDTFLIVILIVVLGLTTWLLLHLMVGKPLDRLKTSLRNNASSDKRTPLVWRNQDELGQVVTAYNNLLHEVEQQAESLLNVNLALHVEIAHRREAEARLARSNDELEYKVSKRTRELEEVNDQLLKLDKQRSAFLSSASHELRTPLAAILGFSVLVGKNFTRHFHPLAQTEEQKKKGEKILSNLEIIGKEGNRLTRLINDLLDLNKIEAGRMEWRDTLLYVGEEISRSAKIIQNTLADNGKVKLVTSVPPRLPPLRCDPDRFQQLLLNLLSNAAKNTDEGTITIEAKPTKGFIRITVADTGRGIPPEHLQSIFDRFFQAGASDTSKPSGTGLGLAICKHIVDHYRGALRAESEVGKGSRFIVLLPPARHF